MYYSEIFDFIVVAGAPIRIKLETIQRSLWFSVDTSEGTLHAYAEKNKQTCYIVLPTAPSLYYTCAGFIGLEQCPDNFSIAIKRRVPSFMVYIAFFNRAVCITRIWIIAAFPYVLTTLAGSPGSLQSSIAMRPSVLPCFLGATVGFQRSPFV